MSTTQVSPHAESKAHAKTILLKVAKVLLWLIYSWVVVVLVLLFLLFILRLLGADPTAGFVEWVYRATERAMAPFRGIFEPIVVSDDSVLDVSVLFAMIVYLFVALGMSLAVDWVTRRLLASIHDEQRLELQAQAIARAAATPTDATSARVVHLSGPTGAHATAVLSAHGGVTFVDLTVSGLQSGEVYDSWFQTLAGARASAGTFQPVTPGSVRVSLSAAVALADCSMFGITLMSQPGVPSVDILAARL